MKELLGGGGEGGLVRMVGGLMGWRRLGGGVSGEGEGGSGGLTAWRLF